MTVVAQAMLSRISGDFRRNTHYP